MKIIKGIDNYFNSKFLFGKLSDPNKKIQVQIKKIFQMQEASQISFK